MKNKKAVFICGSGGSGKSTIAKTHFPGFTIIDVDLIYEEQLIKNNLGLNIENFNKEENEIAKELFEKSKSLNDQKFNESVEMGDDIIIDSIGRDPEVILYQRAFLEKVGYETSMIMVYAELETCIGRVQDRTRVYGKNVTIDSWYLSYSNISIYSKEFHGRFMLIYNDNDNWKDKLKVFIYKKTDKKDII